MKKVDGERRYKKPAFHGEALTVKELGVYKALLRYPTTADVSEKLGVTPNTVKTHVKRIYRKMGVASHVELIQKAMSERECQCTTLPPGVLCPLTTYDNGVKIAANEGTTSVPRQTTVRGRSDR